MSACACPNYEYSDPKVLGKVYVIRRRESDEVDGVFRSADQAYVVAAKKQAEEALKHATIQDRDRFHKLLRSCEYSFKSLYEALREYHTCKRVYEVEEVACPPCPPAGPERCTWDAMREEGEKSVLQEWGLGQKVYRVVCSFGRCDKLGRLYASKEEAYAAAMLKQAALVRMVFERDNSPWERGEFLSVLEEARGKPIEEQHRALRQRSGYACFITFDVEEVSVASLSWPGPQDVIDVVADMFRNSAEKIYLLKSTLPYAHPLRHHSICASCSCPPPAVATRKMVIDRAFTSAREAYALATAKQAQEILHQYTHITHKEPFKGLWSGLAEEGEPEQAFKALKRWVSEERASLSEARDFQVQEFVVKSFLDMETEADQVWEELYELLEGWESQFRPRSP